MCLFYRKDYNTQWPEFKADGKEIARKGTPFRAIIESESAVQGIDSGLGVCDVELLDVSDLAQTGDLAIDRVEFAGCSNWLFQESSSSPAISLLAWSPATTIRGRRTTLV